MSAEVVCEGLVHIYRGGGLEVVALQGLDLRVERGEFVALVGASGSGKTTLMNVLAAVETPSAGRAAVAGHDLTKLGEAARDAYRRTAVGYLWQDAAQNLTPELSGILNLQLPCLAAGADRRRRRERGAELLELVGLGGRGARLPHQLSGGEQQRLALGVALANEPAVLLADEPTAELDQGSASELLRLLRSLQRRLGLTVVMVTHDREVVRHVDRVVRIRDGRTSTETRPASGETVILDRAGRLQLPPALVAAAELGERVRVRREGRRIVISPSDETADG